MTSSSLQRAIDNVEWYHDFDFGNGLRATSRIENVDAVRPVWRFIERQLEHLDFRGKSVLEIGAWDGYWSFYAERRGAARIVATDDLSQNWGSGRGIFLAKELFQSKVEIRQDISIYDLGRLGETFDIIICLGVFYHLHEPLYGFSQLRHRCHSGSLVLLEGSLACSGLRQNEVRYFVNPSLEFLASTSALTALLKASYLDVESQTWMEPQPGSMSQDGPLQVDRAFLVCLPFSRVNDVFLYRPMFGLDVYDPRYEQGLRAQLEIVDVPNTVQAGQRFTARMRVLNIGSCRWAATPAPDDYESMFLGDRIDERGEHAGVKKYRHYLESHDLKGTVTAGVHLFSDVSGGMLQRDYARGFLLSDVPEGQPTEVTIMMQAPNAPGIYAVIFDMVAEYVSWFEWLGSDVEQRYIIVGGDRVSPDSRAPGVLAAQFAPLQCRGDGSAVVSIRNCGDTAWLKGPLSQGGHVQLAIQRLDVDGVLQDRNWMRVSLPHTVLPGDTVVVAVNLADVASYPDTAQIKIDLVAELRCWFEDVGSAPVLVSVSELLNRTAASS